MKKTNTLQQVTKEAKNIQKEYDLCDSCLGRLFAKRLSLSSNKLLGKKIHKNRKKNSHKYKMTRLTGTRVIILRF